MVNKNNCADVDQESQNRSIFRVMELKQRIVDIFIDEEIVEPAYYRDTINLIMSLNGNDSINMHLNTPGGRVDASVGLYNMLRQTPATKIAIVNMAYSGGSFLMLAADVIYLSKLSRVMIHNMSGGFGGKILDVKEQVDFYNEFLYDAYKAILTEEEMGKFKSGLNLWFTAEQIAPKLEKLGKTVKWLYADEPCKDSEKEAPKIESKKKKSKEVNNG